MCTAHSQHNYQDARGVGTSLGVLVELTRIGIGLRALLTQVLLGIFALGDPRPATGCARPTRAQLRVFVQQLLQRCGLQRFRNQPVRDDDVCDLVATVATFTTVLAGGGFLRIGPCMLPFVRGDMPRRGMSKRTAIRSTPPERTWRAGDSLVQSPTRPGLLSRRLTLTRSTSPRYVHVAHECACEGGHVKVAAIYARKSTGQNVAEDAKSVTRQVENAKAFAIAQGWSVDDQFVFIDDGISGADTRRLRAKQQLLASRRSVRCRRDAGAGPLQSPRR